MSYLVLARKYRPRNFSEVVGQEHVVQALTNALTQQRLHHAYLFTGTRGVGKTTVSRILAKSLNCQGADGQGGITATPCGVCAACTEIDSGRFPDYTELDAASNRGVDEVQSLLEQAVYKPVQGRFKVFMIDEVHMLTNTAFNAMLKTLEEPPEYLKFVLATTDPQKVPVTVLSRCLQFNLRPMAPETVLEHLGQVLGQEGVASEPQALRNGPFKASDWLLGSQRVLGGKSFTVSSVQNARLVSAQGELAQLPEPGTPYRLVELRSEQGQVLSVDFSAQPPALSLGERVVLDDLRLQGLRDGASLKGEQGRHFNCPKCGAVVPVRFTPTKSLSCPSCGSLVDLSQGIGKELSYAEQNEPVRPAIPLGSTGALEGLQWQVVGFQHRMGEEAGDDESFGWEEYLLFSQKAGFAFLVDSSDGWSMARVTTGVPKLSKNRSTAKYMGRQYQLESRYTAETTYALGEFYWPVQRGQTTRNVDYVSAGAQNKAFLASETENGETTWSHGSAVSATTLATAFGLKQLRDRSQVGVMSGSRFGLWTIVLGVVILWLVFVMLRGCMSRPNCDPNTDPNCNSYTRSSGGSWGGYTSGGSHK